MESDVALHPAPLIAEVPKLIPAAEYIRRSTDHQKYSSENQSDTIRAYAVRRGMRIVRTYIDDGISGLTFEARDGLQRLIEDVVCGRADFEVILAYDISRWGRFQDADESAYYEFMCKRVGIAVHYCAEPFENDGSLLSAIAKNLKRGMAGEYSRDLSVKVAAGQKRLIRMGFWVGGLPSYGFRRLLVDENRVPKCELSAGQWKNIATDRIILVPGPPEEVVRIRWMFNAFVHEHVHPLNIARLLNAQGVTRVSGHPWSAPLVRGILRNEKYVGNNVWGRETSDLRRKRAQNRPETWLRVKGAFEPIVDKALFDAAQRIFDAAPLKCDDPRTRRYSDQEMLDALRRLLEERGDLSRRIVAESPITPSPGTYNARFGSLTAAYRIIGFTPPRVEQGLAPIDPALGGRRPTLSPEAMLEALRRLLKEHGYLSSNLIEESKSVPACSSYYRRFGSLSAAYQLIGYTSDPKRWRRLRRSEGRSASNQALLVSLREALQRCGRLSNAIIDEERSLPCSMTYVSRFGSIMNAYRLIGYIPDRYQTRYNRPKGLSDREILDALRRLWQKKGRLSLEIIGASSEVPSQKTFVSRFGCLTRAYALIGYPSRRRRMTSLRLPEEQMLERLRGLLHKHGFLSGALIDESPHVPTRTAYKNHFGGLKGAYRAIGYKPDFFRNLSPRPRGLRKQEMLAILRRLLKRYGRLTQEIIDEDKSVPSYYQYKKKFHSLRRACRLIGFDSKRQKMAAD